MVHHGEGWRVRCRSPATRRRSWAGNPLHSHPPRTYAVQGLRRDLAAPRLPLLHRLDGEQARHDKVQQRGRQIVHLHVEAGVGQMGHKALQHGARQAARQSWLRRQRAQKARGRAPAAPGSAGGGGAHRDELPEGHPEAAAIQGSQQTHDGPHRRAASGKRGWRVGPGWW